MLNSVDYHIIDKCNLNCASCNHFSSLVPEDSKGKSIEQITADFSLLSKIKDEFYALNLLGGEPTLHPQLSKILRIAREMFPNNTINLTTNGTRYNMFELWKDAIIENNICLYITVYPYCDNYKDRLETIAKTLKPYDNIVYIDFPIDSGFNYGFLSNKIVCSESEYKNCEKPYWCSQLKNGKLYKCYYAAQFDVLKNYFGDEITFDLDGKEYLDLNGDITFNDLNKFIYSPQPEICKHCLEVCNAEKGGLKHPWSKTCKDINEWIVE